MSRSLEVSRRLGQATALALCLTACAETPAPAPPVAPAPATASTDATLSLAVGAETPTEAAVDLLYVRDPAKPGPRMMELHLKLMGDLHYLHAERLAAAEAAGKDLVVQDAKDGTLRVILYTTANTNRLAPGPLARLWFSHGAGTVSLIEQSPIFAPPEADLGVTLGGPLTLGGAR